VKLFNIMVHMLTETARHAGHADILRERLDGAVGTAPGSVASERDDAFWEHHVANVEQAARAATTRPSVARRPDAHPDPRTDIRHE
jgi:hypothetical protein